MFKLHPPAPAELCGLDGKMTPRPASERVSSAIQPKAIFQFLSFPVSQSAFLCSQHWVFAIKTLLDVFSGCESHATPERAERPRNLLAC